MSQMARVVNTLELLEFKVHASTDLAGRLATANACNQLLRELKSLRDSFSLRAYVELYERAVSLECILRDSSAENVS